MAVRKKEPAATKAEKAAEAAEIFVPEIKKESIQVAVVGTSPLICARMSEKSRHEILLPKGRKNAAEKQATAKHNPLEEFRASPYILSEDYPTLIGLMASAFKGAMGTAALDLPGTKKAQIGRLSYVVGDYVSVYGLPKVFMSIVRSADINKTPDVRTRAILPRWAAQITIEYVKPLLNAQAIINLLSAGGVTAGVGDWRPEKGKGSYGQYRVTNVDDPEFVEILKEGDRDAQIEGMENALPYDNESAEMLAWYREEAPKRGFTL